MPKKVTFSGGVHPPENKHATEQAAISPLAAPERVVIALSQHIGAPATCQVNVGDRVCKGDLIGEIPENALGARIHASIDGVVESIDGGVVTIKAA